MDGLHMTILTFASFYLRLTRGCKPGFMDNVD